MYPVSEAYLEAIGQHTVATNWTGSIKTTRGAVHYLSPRFIVKDKCKLTRQICPRDSIAIGTTCAAQLELTAELEIDRYALMDAEVEMSFWLRVGTDWEEVPLGIFTVKEPPVRSRQYTTLCAYDNMVKFDKSFGATVIGKPYNLLYLACVDCGVELGMSQDQIAVLPNGLKETWSHEDVPIYTYRDEVGYLAAFLGCFAYIGVDGKLYLRQYGTTPDRSISPSWRKQYLPTDYESWYSAITAYYHNGQETDRVSLQAGGLDYELGENPFLQFNEANERRQVMTNILAPLSEAVYTPFSASLPCDPSIMPGDVLEFTGNHAVEGKLSVVGKQVITMRGGMTVECGGDDPNLQATEMEKKLRAMAQDRNRDSMFYYDFVNAAEMSIRAVHPARIILFNYVATRRTHVDFHAEIKCHVDVEEGYNAPADQYTERDAWVQVTYYLGGEVVTSYSPVEMLLDGTQLIHLVYTWWASENTAGSFEVEITAYGCEISIGRECARGYIAGTGLVGDAEWDGTIYIQEDFKRRDLSALHKAMADSISLRRATPIPEDGITQRIRFMDFAQILRKGMTDGATTASLHRFSVPYNRGQVFTVDTEINGDSWVNGYQKDNGTVTTPNCRVERVLRVTSAHNSGTGDVTYLASFDAGASWWLYANGWSFYEEGYGMAEGVMKAIPETEWRRMLAGGRIMIRAILQGDAALQDIQIYTSEGGNYLTITHEDADSYDEDAVLVGKEQITLRHSWEFELEAGEIDTGLLHFTQIDSSQYSSFFDLYLRTYIWEDFKYQRMAYDQSFRTIDRGDTLCTLAGVTYTKADMETAVYAVVYIRELDISGPVLIADQPIGNGSGWVQATYYNVNGTTVRSQGSFHYQGEDYNISAFYGFVRGDQEDSSSHHAHKVRVETADPREVGTAVLRAAQYRHLYNPRYLLADEEDTLYTIAEGELRQVDGELSGALFAGYGCGDLDLNGAVPAEIQNPKIYVWQEKEIRIPVGEGDTTPLWARLGMDALPPVPQAVRFAEAVLTDRMSYLSIAGDEESLWSVSFNGGEWKMRSGDEWVSAGAGEGNPKAALELLGEEDWNLGEGDGLRVRCLLGAGGWISAIRINYKEEE